jgi:hypothetical protein
MRVPSRSKNAAAFPAEEGGSLSPPEALGMNEKRLFR